MNDTVKADAEDVQQSNVLYEVSGKELERKGWWSEGAIYMWERPAPTVLPLCGRLQYQPPRSEVLVREMSVNTWDFYCSLVWRAVAATSTSVHSPPTSLTARIAARASPNLEIDGW